MSESTKRYPRTMEEAFGPGHRGGIVEDRPKWDTEDAVVLLACLGAVLAVAFMAAIGWLP